MKNNAQDLLALTTALEIAKTNDFIKTQHAKDVFMKALEESGFNTPKPVRRELATATAPSVITTEETINSLEVK